jgi:hypothetical protein
MLLERETLPVETAVARLAGMQAQIPRPPYLGLWTRLAGFERGTLSAALRERRIVRSTAWRATLHLLTATDFLLFRGSIQPMLSRGMRGILRDRAESFDMEELLAEARTFFGARPATFNAARTHLAARFPVADERALGYAVRTHLPLVQVPDGSAWGFPAAADFALADAWLGRPVPEGSEGLPQLVRRYLAAFGPASIADAQCWSGLSGLRSTFEALRGELATFRDPRGRELFDLPAAPRPAEECAAPVRFLPEYDNLLLAHDDRSRVVPEAWRARLITKNLQVPGTFLVDGMIAGTFKVERTKKVASLRLTPFGRLLKRDLAALEKEGDALLRFAEEEATTREVVLAPSPA